MTDKELLPDYVDRRQWKFNPITGEPLIDGWPLYSGLPKRDFKFSTIEEAMQPAPEPTKLINVNNVLEQAGYVKKKEWVGLTAKDLAEIPPSCFEGAIWADAKLKEKNNG